MCTAYFSSILISTTGPLDGTIQVQNICTGNFQKNGSFYHYDLNGFHPYTGKICSLCISIGVFMVAIKFRRYQINKNDQDSTPMDLESNLLNFNIIALIILHRLLQGYNQKKQVCFFQISLKCAVCSNLINIKILSLFCFLLLCLKFQGERQKGKGKNDP